MINRLTIQQPPPVRTTITTELQPKTYTCIVCDRNADGFIELALGWHDEPLPRLYICKIDYDRIHSDDSEQEKWYKI